MTRTPSAILGPYYRGPDTGYTLPVNNKQFILPNHSFGNLNLSIHIVDATSGARIHFARVEVWQADENGIYDNSNPRPWTTPEQYWPNTSSYRGVFAPYGAGHQGTLYTNIPGRYYQAATTDSPAFWREPHIHFKISKPGFQTLVTQVFFPRDPSLPASEDPYYVPENIVQGNYVSHGVTSSYFVFQI